MAVGLDCGTSFYICAREESIKKQRNAFLTVDGEANQAKRMLKRQHIPYVEKANKVHIVGQHAFNYAQIFSTAQLRRPMKRRKYRHLPLIPFVMSHLGRLGASATGLLKLVYRDADESARSKCINTAYQAIACVVQRSNVAILSSCNSLIAAGDGN